MTEPIDAADLLDDCLAESGCASDLPPSDELLDAFDELLGRQQDVYEQILLPRLGLGERYDVAPQEVTLADDHWSLRGGEIWLFDGHPDQSWLHAPLMLPFHEIDDALTLLRRASMPADLLDRLRPPLVMALRHALAALTWVPADTGGYEGGRMEYDEFIEELGERRWYQVDHDPTTGAARFEVWIGDEPLAGWSANVYDAFECAVTHDPDYPVPARLARRWSIDPELQPFETALAADQLSDPYAVLRRLIWHDARLDIERLGPLATWKDAPDALFEYRDDEDSLLADLAGWLEDEFDLDDDTLRPVIDDWFDAICDEAPVDLPGIGVVYAIEVPAIRLTCPPSLYSERPPDQVRLPRQGLWAATDKDPEGWVE